MRTAFTELVGIGAVKDKFLAAAGSDTLRSPTGPAAEITRQMAADCERTIAELAGLMS